MGDSDTMRLVYLAVLLLAIGASVWTLYRGHLGQMLRHFLIWVLVCALIVIAYDNRHLLEGTLLPAQQSVDRAGNVTLLRNREGYFQVRAQVNGTTVEFIVDTGASLIVLSKADARRAGIDIDGLTFDGVAATANGEVRFARVLLESLVLGEAVDANVLASVNAGDLDTSLLGLAYLNRFRRIVIEGDVMRLER